MKKKLAGVLTAGLIIAGMTGSVFAGEPSGDVKDYEICFNSAISMIGAPTGSEVSYSIQMEDGSEEGVFFITVDAEPFDYEELINGMDELTSDEKDRLITAYKECEPYEENISNLIEQMENADEQQQEFIMAQINELTASIEKIMEQVADITDKIQLPYMTSFIAFCSDEFDYEEFVNSIEDLTQDEKDKLIQLNQELTEYTETMQDLVKSLEDTSGDEKETIEKQIKELSELISEIYLQQSEIFGDKIGICVEAAPAVSLDDMPKEQEPSAA